MKLSHFVIFLTLLLKLSKPLFAVLGKLLTVILKLFKGGGAVKLALGAGSFAAYSVLYDWRFAICILVLIGIHESGHVWAMKQQGMKTKGFYFIPFFGGMAVPEEEFPDAYTEAYVALMGPIWGLFVSFATYLIYIVTGQVVFMVATCWMALVNLINLLPIYPFDGGRVLRALTNSVTNTAGAIIMLSIGTLAIVFCWFHGYMIFVVFGIMGTLEEFLRRIKEIKKFAEDSTDRFRHKTIDEIGRALCKIIQPDILDKEKGFPVPFSGILGEFFHDPYGEKISTLASLRIKFSIWKYKFKKLDKISFARGVTIRNPLLILASDNPADVFQDHTQFNGTVQVHEHN